MKDNKQDVYEILRCGDYYPSRYKRLIDYYFENEVLDKVFHSDWIEFNDDNIIACSYKHMHFFNIYVFYDTDIEVTTVKIKFLEQSYADELKRFHIMDGVDYYNIYCDGMGNEEFLGEFGHVFDEFYSMCSGIEYRMEEE